MAPHWIRRLLPLELLLIRRMSFLRRVPVLRRVSRQVTARLTLSSNARPCDGLSFRLDFETPYLRLPVEVERLQIGIEDAHSGFRSEAFRFFDWQSWAHIDGKIEWHGGREAILNGRAVPLVKGFSYRSEKLPEGIGNLGLRIAEGVEGTLRVLWGDAVVSVGFDPGYWLLESGSESYRIVPIRDTDLMVLIVSLSEIGTGNRKIYNRAVENLSQWVAFRWGREDPEIRMFLLLQKVRDWGPLGMAPLYEGLVETLSRIGVEDQERILFEFYADHWGIRNNEKGRLLAVRTLEALGTDSALSALREILSYVRYRAIGPDELARMRGAAAVIEGKLEEGAGAP